MVEPEIAVKSLLLGATSERQRDIEDLWERYAPKVSVVEDAKGINWTVPGSVDKYRPHAEARSKASGLMPPR